MPESKTLVQGGPSGPPLPNPAQNTPGHQMRPFRGVADREIVTAGAERAAVAGPTDFLGLGSFSLVLGAMRATRCARQPQSSNGRQAAMSCTGAVL